MRKSKKSQIIYSFGKPLCQIISLKDKKRKHIIMRKNWSIKDATKIFNDFFSSIMKHLKIERNKSDDKDINFASNPILPTTCGKTNSNFQLIQVLY